MTKEQIRKAAKDVADKVCNATDCIEWENLVFAFEDGANWRINSVWHKPEEVPAPNKDFFMMIDEESKKTMLWRIYPQHTVDDWPTLIKANCVVRWAYADDLIPTKDETA